MKANTLQRLFILVLTATLTACASMKSESPAAAGNSGGDLSAALASAGRPAEDKARDADRKPAELMQFFGVRPGMTTVDIIALGGYVTEVLSVAVGPNGKVYA
jgi:predicted methyltransferase